MKRARQVLGLFFQFMKFGLFTFGGGWSIVAQMQKLYVEQEKVITSEELLDLTSVGRSLPGTMIGNVAMLYGYRVAGVAGGMACRRWRCWPSSRSFTRHSRITSGWRRRCAASARWLCRS